MIKIHISPKRDNRGILYWYVRPKGPITRTWNHADGYTIETALLNYMAINNLTISDTYNLVN